MELLQFTPARSDAICVCLTKFHSLGDRDFLIIMTLLSFLCFFPRGEEHNLSQQDSECCVPFCKLILGHAAQVDRWTVLLLRVIIWNNMLETVICTKTASRIRGITSVLAEELASG